MSNRDKKKSDHRKLSQIIKALHKSSPKLMAEEQRVSIKNAKKTILQVDWRGRRKYIYS